MIRYRSTRAASLALTLSLALTSLVGPAAIFGAQPTADHVATSVPGKVSPGANVAFDVHFKNTDNSNLSQVYLNAATPAGATLVAVQSASQGSCSGASGNLSCTLGAVRAGASVDVRVIYTSPTGQASFTVPFLFSTTGVAADKGKNSHGDDYQTPGTVSLDASSDFAGAYTASAGQAVSDNQSLARSNPQFTKVNAPAGAIGVTVGEVGGATFACPPVAGGHCFGQWSVISVNSGASYGAGFSVVLGYKGNIGNAKFVHVLDNGTAEAITATCTSKTSPASFNCKWIETASGNSFVTIWLTQNGRLSGY
jgi:hypothetical protein